MTGRGKQRNARQLHQLWYVETTDHTNMTFISTKSKEKDNIFPFKSPLSKGK
jgi:hypothetical protein